MDDNKHQRGQDRKNEGTHLRTPGRRRPGGSSAARGGRATRRNERSDGQSPSPELEHRSVRPLARSLSPLLLPPRSKLAIVASIEININTCYIYMYKEVSLIGSEEDDALVAEERRTPQEPRRRLHQKERKPHHAAILSGFGHLEIPQLRHRDLVGARLRARRQRRTQRERRRREGITAGVASLPLFLSSFGAERLRGQS